MHLLVLPQTHIAAHYSYCYSPGRCEGGAAMGRRHAVTPLRWWESIKEQGSSRLAFKSRMPLHTDKQQISRTPIHVGTQRPIVECCENLFSPLGVSVKLLVYGYKPEEC
ncbi:hypothetical protein GOP47_0025522 [Adiantum capillus-veneris]|uniref:Uncharacterized protein n=1 Tax=Adiantum capillus-veneris TaxID=13818 RepID=A0A9D4U0R0_ADICA|nr:hypothetical protein GOP47_0025522 [Adiantum capillus-veneris]